MAMVITWCAMNDNQTDKDTEWYCETEYRRGYCDGFIQAIMDFSDLLDENASHHNVYDYLFDFWQFALQDDTEDDFPPSVEIKILRMKRKKEIE